MRDSTRPNTGPGAPIYDRLGGVLEVFGSRSHAFEWTESVWSVRSAHHGTLNWWLTTAGLLDGAGRTDLTAAIYPRGEPVHDQAISTLG
jgi:hypothetical protein